jgi:hypothetical protein
VAGAIVLGLFTLRSARRKTLTWWWLFFVSGALCWWMETVGDWGQYLVYSPKFAHYRLPWRHSSPVNPWFMPWAYGLYWGVHAVVVLRLAAWLSRRTGWRRGTGVLLLAAPVGFAWDLLVEGVATHYGWWTYDPPLGPWFDAGAGKQPLVVPIIIMFTWPNLMAWLAGDPHDAGPNYIERLFRLDRLRPLATQSLQAPSPLQVPGPARSSVALLAEPVAASALSTTAAPFSGRFAWRFELARLGAWLLVFQLSFLLLLDVPLVVLRMTIGHPSAYLP